MATKAEKIAAKKKELEALEALEGDDDDDDGDDTSPIVSLSQNKIDKIVNDSFKRGAKNSAEAKEAKKAAEDLATLRTEHETLQADLKKLRDAGPGASTNDGDGKEDVQAKIDAIRAEYDLKLDAMTEAKDEFEKTSTAQVQQLRDSSLRGVVIAAAAKAGAHEPEDVLILMQNKGLVKFDEETGDWQPLNAKGQVRVDVDEGGEVMSVAKAVGEFVNENAHMQRASGRQGSGNPADNGGKETPDLPTNIGGGEIKKPSDVYKHGREIVAHLQGGGSGEDVKLGGKNT